MNSSVIAGHIIQINHLELGPYKIDSFNMSRSECISINASDREFKDAILAALLLKNTDLTGLEYLEESVKILKPKEKQALRRRVSYWPRQQEELIDDNFIKLKKNMLGKEMTDSHQTAKLFLDHLMIGDSLSNKYKRLCYSLLMNAPELLIIDEGFDLLPEETSRALLRVFSRYAEKSGMAIINFTRSESLLEFLSARHFEMKDNRLVEIMPDK